MNTTSRPRTKRHRLALLALPALLALSACATPFNANVSRYQRELPAPAGQTFAVVADDPRDEGGLEFAQYASLVSAQLQKLGYVPGNPQTSDLVVRFDYGVDKGRDKVRTTGFSDPYFGGWYGPGWGGWGHPGFYGRRGWGYGWYDPFFWGGPGYQSVDVVTVYASGIDMKIDRRADGRRLFEGKAEAASTSDRLPYLVPNLVEAMFTDFPGHNGETVRISVAPEKKKR
ncbi:DUF4136 domain-containing protein [Novosphingobium sp. KCTC 2891]|uniref:DUF4136 domain-containing protein n=1 Tax=Novosphingobium sp. KCTC 2891 TaxID=2989730 RepID=UPI002223CD48|nr:DUF4136 domain-containing protein [Novosphingobium sp. KCTC 2891]MCW1383188.1 DUF4136 domain-containing protein [Novosphingobium sp. KCTC 2891]